MSSRDEWAKDKRPNPSSQPGFNDPPITDFFKGFSNHALGQLRLWLEDENPSSCNCTPLAPVKLMGRVLGGGSFLVSGTRYFVSHGGTAIRVDRALPAGTKLGVDFGHQPPFHELSVVIHAATGWGGDDKAEEPWERNPWFGNVFGNNAGATFDVDITPFTTLIGSLGLSSLSKTTGDTITWTKPVAHVEQNGINTTNGHFGYLFSDSGAGVAPANNHFAISRTSVAAADWSVFNNHVRSGSSAISVGAVVVSGTTSENALTLTLPNAVAAGTWLVVVSCCETSSSATFNSSTGRPRVFVNWGLDEYINDR